MAGQAQDVGCAARVRPTGSLQHSERDPIQASHSQPEEQEDHVRDRLFKPKFGADIQKQERAACSRDERVRADHSPKGCIGEVSVDHRQRSRANCQCVLCHEAALQPGLQGGRNQPVTVYRYTSPQAQSRPEAALLALLRLCCSLVRLPIGFNPSLNLELLLVADGRQVFRVSRAGGVQLDTMSAIGTGGHFRCNFALAFLD